jgi:hypothetical protein
LVAQGLCEIMDKYKHQKPADFWRTMKKCVDPFSARQYLTDKYECQLLT